ncbi:alpha/beta fold hydrolase [Streptomyces rimosus]|uniref:alpha/beta fold hydrolase n=1 Tax=Streptomyces rimosus TaxID=1927 RepID=UPI0012FEE66C
MTTFVLVSGGYTGGWIWREVADHLRAMGHRAEPVTLTGMGDRRHLSGPGTDLNTHIEDVAQVLDHVGAGEEDEAGETVLVAHCYGAYPALGAAGPPRTGWPASYAWTRACPPTACPSWTRCRTRPYGNDCTAAPRSTATAGACRHRPSRRPTSGAAWTASRRRAGTGWPASSHRSRCPPSPSRSG